MAIVSTAQFSTNPLSGTFGTGNIKWFRSSGTFIVPAGIGKVRARMWGGGGYVGGGGGFALIAVYNLYGVTSIPVTVGSGGTTSSTTGGTSSFGSYASATGGLNSTSGGGSGVNGDINSTGGGATGGGAASIYGNGGTPSIPSQGGAGAGGSNWGYSGFLMSGGYVNTGSTTSSSPPTMLVTQFNLDWIGTGYGSSNGIQGANGGGGGGGSSNLNGNFPGGGGGATSGNGAPGLVIVEW